MEYQKKTVRCCEQKRALLNRLKRIEGQIRGLESLIEKDAYCNDILQQSAAAGAALTAFNKQLLGAHVKNCVARDIREGKDGTIDELLKTIDKLIK